MSASRSTRCDIAGCKCSWGWETDRRKGTRKLRLCAAHAERWFKGEAEFYAELEEVAGRVPPREPRPGTAAALHYVGRGNDKRRTA